MSKVLSYEAVVRGGLVAQTKLVVPVQVSDPASPQDGWVWVNTTDHVLRFRENGATKTLAVAGLDAEAVQDIVGTMLVAGNNIDLNYNDTNGTITIDVESLTSADIANFITDVRGAISTADTATLDLSYSTGVLSGTVLDSPTVGTRSASYLLNTDNHVDGSVNHVFTALDDSKLAGIATGATANATDAYLRDRTNHTGTQVAATISDLASAVAALSINAATLNGSTAAQLQTAITAAIVDAAPGTLDTLNEIAAALGDDPNFATTITNGLAARARFFSANLTGGALTEAVTHNLNTRDLHVSVYVNSGVYEEEDYIIQRTSANVVTVVSEGVVIPVGRRINITTAA